MNRSAVHRFGLWMLVVLISGVVVSDAASKPAGPGPGNSPSAKQCQKGGWQNLYTSTGSRFSSQAACVSYSAGGGTLLQSPPPPPTRTLTVSKAGSGSGTVTSTPTGIDCGSDCSEGYTEGTSVTLTATAASGSTFAGWSDACSGTTCTVSISADKTAVATFNTTPPPPLITPAISLGFADTFRTGSPDLGVPAPWAGDPNVVFVGCTAGDCGGGGSYSAGAIRIDNGAAASLTLTNAYVDVGDCRFQPWGELLPATAQPGQSLVLTQTGQLGPPQPAPCDALMSPEFPALHNFETSLPPELQCDPTIGSVPMITLVFEDGRTLTVTDADKVLNTGGVHRNVCTGRGHYTPWTAVDPANIVITP